ncbi:MAG: oligosaccharide flippase family protein [Myxococcaceae bacterium]
MAQTVPHSESQKDSLDAVRNALKLGASLVVTLAMAFGVRLFLPRYFGPDLFGPLKFAEAYAAAFFVFLGLGLDIYIRREVAVRPEHATDFLGGILLARVFLAVLLFAGMDFLLARGGGPQASRALVFVFGGAQFLLVTNTSLAALLQARGKVDGLSWSNIATKALWGGLIALAIGMGVGTLGVATALLVSEVVKSVVLVALVQKHLGWRLQVNWAATWAVIAASFPFYLNTVAHTVYAKVGVSFLAFLSKNAAEVGRYGAASDLAGLTLTITPLINWVLLPLYARARARSDDEFNATLRRSLEFILSLGIPVSLMLGLGAELWMRVAFGAEYVAGAGALRILAPLFALTYVAMVCATCLTNLNRAWTLTLVSVLGLLLNPLLNWVLIRLAIHSGQPDAAGAACAWADVITEVAVTGAMLLWVGRRAFDRRSAIALCKTLGVTGGVVVLHVLLAPLGHVRLLLDAAAYSIGVLASGALRFNESVTLVRTALANRHKQVPA